MAKEFYFFGLDLHVTGTAFKEPLRCKVLSEEIPPQDPAMGRYIIELYDPIPTSAYINPKFIRKDDPKFNSRFVFFPTGYRQMRPEGPFWGTVGSAPNATKDNLDGDGIVGDRALLCTSLKQAGEYLSFLEEVKKQKYLIDFGVIIRKEYAEEYWQADFTKQRQMLKSGAAVPPQACQIIKEIVFEKTEHIPAKRWLARVSFSSSDKPERLKNNLAWVLLTPKDFPMPGQSISIHYIYIDHDNPDADSFKPEMIKTIGTWEEGSLWRPQDRQREIDSLKKSRP
ncbi:hypothetical protein HY772_08945 [Candidatus Woesearchaeota archaeon]|nr:hypothetical protein [Candidatus Woesearchaeota archaeon]